MHSTASRESSVVSQAIYGTHVEYLESQPGWVKIRTPDDYSGWMESAALRELKAGEPAYAASGKVMMVASLFAHLYSEKSVARHQPLLTMPYETKLEIESEPEEEERRWLGVRLADGRSAWVQRGDVEEPGGIMTVEQVIELARRFMGLPYTWGGTSSFGYDCSGFTQMLLRRRGVVLPRDARIQAPWEGLTPVDRGHLEKGDLLYFGNDAGRITHTGLYIGAGEFIHATAHKRPVVQVSRLEEEHWTKSFVCARRLK